MRRRRAPRGRPRATSSSPPPLARRPANIDAATARPGRSRARAPTSSGSSRFAALSSSGGASLPRFIANAIWARSRSASGALELVERSRLRHGQQSQRRVGRAGLAAWPAPRRAPARPGVPGRASARRHARGRRPRRPVRRAPALGRPSARARRRRPRRVPAPPAHDARRGGRDRRRVGGLRQRAVHARRSSGDAAR